MTITNGTTSSSDNSNISAGAVYVYKRTGSNWVQEAYVKPSNNDAGDNFGASIAISGNTLVVASRNEDSNQTTITNSTSSSSDDSVSNSGAVFVYIRSGSNWSQEAYIKPGFTNINGYFGLGLEISADTIVVGAPGEESNQSVITNGPFVSSDTSLVDSGAVYVYRNSSRLFNVSEAVANHPDSTSVKLDWTKTGVFTVGYKISYVQGIVPPIDCDTGLGTYDAGDVDNYTITGLSSGEIYTYLICSYDSGVGVSDGMAITETVPSNGPGCLLPRCDIPSGNGNGTGTYQADLQFDVQIGDIKSADLNEDGYLDLIYTTGWGPSTGYYCINNGSGGFPTCNSFNQGAWALGITVADFNGDGHVDFITSAAGGN